MEIDVIMSVVRAIHDKIRDAVIRTCETSPGTLSEVAHDGEGDTIYCIDRVSETMLVELFEGEIASRDPIVLIAEGLPGGSVVLPPGTPADRAVWRIIADPIDGTRSLMYQKRSAWILTGIARNHGPETTLENIEAAVQTEIPLVKQHLCDTLWAIRGSGAHGERLNRVGRTTSPLVPKPWTATNLAHGFGSVTRFFSGARDILAAIDDEIVLSASHESQDGKAYSFEDQYLSSGGQLYELIMGHDRFQADLRPLLRPILKQRGLPVGLCCHPYDLCTELIAREAGVVITNEAGSGLSAPLNTTADLCWIGYANLHIQLLIEPLLRAALARHRLTS